MNKHRNIYKKWLVIIYGLMIVFTFTINAEELKPLYTESKKWIWKATDPHGCTYGDPIFITVISSRIDDSNLYALNIKYVNSFGDESPDYKQVYEEDGICYIMYREEFVPIIDFNINIGEKIWGLEPVIDNSIREVRGVERRVVEIWHYDHTAYWIEGIGATSDAFLATFDVHPGDIVRLIACYDGDKCIYQQGDLPENSSVQTVNDNSAKTDAYYDLHGRQVRNPQPGSIYIRNGKKTVF